MNSEFSPNLDRNKFLLSYFETDFLIPPQKLKVINTVTAEWLVMPLTREDRILMAVRVTPMGQVDSFELNLDSPDSSQHVQTDGNADILATCDNVKAQIDMGLTTPNTDELALVGELVDVLSLDIQFDQ